MKSRLEDCINFETDRISPSALSTVASQPAVEPQGRSSVTTLAEPDPEDANVALLAENLSPLDPNILHESEKLERDCDKSLRELLFLAGDAEDEQSGNQNQNRNQQVRRTRTLAPISVGFVCFPKNAKEFSVCAHSRSRGWRLSCWTGRRI